MARTSTWSASLLLICSWRYVKKQVHLSPSADASRLGLSPCFAWNRSAYECRSCLVWAHNLCSWAGDQALTKEVCSGGSIRCRLQVPGSSSLGKEGDADFHHRTLAKPKDAVGALMLEVAVHNEAPAVLLDELMVWTADPVCQVRDSGMGGLWGCAACCCLCVSWSRQSSTPK